MTKIYKNIEYLVWKNPEMLFFCGYVKLPDNHKWIEHLRKTKKIKGLSFKITYYDLIPVECHGGITFGEYIKKDTERFTKGYWIGWDYCHSTDYIPMIPNLKGKKLKVWTEKQVENECFKVIEQILKNES